MQILIFNEPEGKLMTILQTFWDPREALGLGKEAGQSDKQEERGGREENEDGEGHSSGCRGG